MCGCCCERRREIGEVLTNPTVEEFNSSMTLEGNRKKAAIKIQREYRAYSSGKKPANQLNDSMFEEYGDRITLTNPVAKVY